MTWSDLSLFFEKFVSCGKKKYLFPSRPPIEGNFVPVQKYVRKGCDASLLAIIEKAMINAYMGTSCRISTDILEIIYESAGAFPREERYIQAARYTRASNINWIVICGRFGTVHIKFYKLHEKPKATYL